MFDKKVFEYFDRLILFCRKLGASPFDWDGKTRQLFSTKKDTRKARFELFVKIAYTIYCVTKAILLRGNLNYFNICLVFGYAFCLNCLISMPATIYEKGLAAVVNCSCRFILQYQERWYDLKDPYLLKLNTYMIQSFQALAISLSLAWTFAMWMYLWAPLTPPLPYEGLPSFLQGWISYLVVGYWYCFLIMKASATIVLTAIITLIYIICLFPIITNHLRADVPVLSRNFEKLRNPKNLSLVYRCVEIWHAVFLENCGYLLIPIQFLVAQFALLVNYLVITKWYVMQDAAIFCMMFTSFIVQGGWLGFTTFGAWFRDNSIKVLQSWNNIPGTSKAEMKYMDKFRKSCRPLYIGHPGMFKITRATVLKYIQGVSRGTFNVLLGLEDA
ncbi:hypothetical protein Fcan01_27394 [Folsomia candida]|uniref:Odorant receptor n=1 Tax=Folsomia candida TaxID=158441 RepID=A0A226CWV4_FOLCA|nr:hypothetical protein Fcan01_27394 [Folsomia candida]